MVGIGEYAVLFISLLVVLYFKFKDKDDGTLYAIFYAIAFTGIIPHLNIFFELASHLEFPYYMLGWLLLSGLLIFILSKIVGGMIVMASEIWYELVGLVPRKAKVPSVTSVQIQKLIGGRK